MKVQDLAAETVLSLSANKARSGLTVLGIVVGIASVITMVAIGAGAQNQIESSIQSIGSNLITVIPGSEQSSGVVDSLTMDDVEALGEATGVAAVAPVVQTQLTVTSRSANETVSITGTSASYTSIRSVGLGSGAWFTETQALGAAKVAVLGPDTSDQLFGEGSTPVGQRIRIGGQPFTVIGVAESKGSSGFANTDEAVYVPALTAQRYLSGSDGLTALYVEAADADAVDAVQDTISQVLLRQHQIADPADADFTIYSQKDISATLGTVTSLLTLLLGSIAGISLVVGGIGIMNMMLTSVTERIREIGLRKAIGSTRGEITWQFLAESVMLTVSGGIVGILVGWGLAALITLFSPITAVVSTGSVVLAVGVSTTIGVVFGFYPARRAAKLDPIVALRYQ